MALWAMRIFAPAKLNLFLHVTGRRADGYHLLQSLMAFVDIGDELEFSAHDSLHLEVRGPFAQSLAQPEDNLVYKAAQLLSAQYKIMPQVKIILTKNLPVASGLGGGSADAAVALRGLAQLWNLPENLEHIARQLGADVPACLYRKFVWTEGTGEKMTFLPDAPDLHFVLVNPLISTPTAEVFKNFRNGFSPPLVLPGVGKSAEEWLADLRLRRNDLTDAAISVTPAIQDVLAALAKTEGCLLHRLSGSGATCFGIYRSKAAAESAAGMLKTRYPQWWVVSAGMLEHSH